MEKRYWESCEVIECERGVGECLGLKKLKKMKMKGVTARVFRIKKRKGCFSYLFILIFLSFCFQREGSLNEILKRDVESPSFGRRAFYFFFLSSFEK